ncbi:hypothetical protein PENTCL1PPCAC_21288, partial [Pristionchus entomophagus]
DSSDSMQESDSACIMDLPNKLLVKIFQYLDLPNRLKMRLNKILDKVQLSISNKFKRIIVTLEASMMKLTMVFNKDDGVRGKPLDLHFSSQF